MARKRRTTRRNPIWLEGSWLGFTDALDSFAPRKGMVPRSRPLPAVDIDDEPRPEPRPGLKLCECGLPVIPGADMCRRCAMLDYGTDAPSVVAPRGRRARILDFLYGYRRGRSVDEITRAVGGYPSATRTMLMKLERMGRLESFDCKRKKRQATCYRVRAGTHEQGRHRLADIISSLRHRPEGATLTEILFDLGEDPHEKTARNTIEQMFIRMRKQGTDERIRQMPCVRKGQRTVCYHLDAPRRRKRRKR